MTTDEARGRLLTNDYHPSGGRLREGTAWAVLILEQHTVLSPLYIHLFHAERVILFLTP